MVRVRKKDMIKMVGNIHKITLLSKLINILTYHQNLSKFETFCYMIDGINRNNSDFISIFRLENVFKIMF